MRDLGANEQKRRISRKARILDVPCTENDIEKRDAIADKKKITVGTLSFPINSSKMRQSFRDNSKIIATILKQRRPALLLCAGWSIPKESLAYVVSSTRRLKTIAILESIDAPAGRTYWKIKGGRSTQLGSQKFGKREQVKKNHEYLRRLANEAESRSFRFAGRNVFLLICGEIVIVKGQNNVRFEEGVSTKLFDMLRAQDAFVLNPTHTRMANDGIIKSWRRFLSQGRRLYLSVSNWDLGGKRIQSPSATLHSFWCGGKCQKAVFKLSHRDFEYREFTLSLTSNSKGNGTSACLYIGDPNDEPFAKRLGGTGNRI
jgi:hypothetical protein